MSLDKLEEMGYKPKKTDVAKEEKATSAKLELDRSRIRKETLDLFLEGLTDPDQRELIIYGMYVKKYLAPLTVRSPEERIEKTLEHLAKVKKGT